MSWHNQVKHYLSPILQGDLIANYHNSTVTILGGTGFIGKWILSTLLEANTKGLIRVNINLVTRDSVRAAKLFPDHKDSINLFQHDFSLPESHFELPFSDYFIYAATPTKPSSGLQANFGIISEAEVGIRSILGSAYKFGNCPRVIHLSSGIVYGTARAIDRPIQETNELIIESSADSYYRAKIAIERMLVDASLKGLIRAANPRLFAFAGPGLSINEHFAVGNFIADVLAGRKIQIKGHPDSARSYMHPVDLTKWLLTILISPTLEPINVGSSRRISILELAEILSGFSSTGGISVIESDSQPNYYYPKIMNAYNLYNLEETIGLEEVLESWLDFLRINK